MAASEDLGDPWAWVPPDDLKGVEACIARSYAEEFGRDIETDCEASAKLGALECYAPAFIGEWYLGTCVP